ncbi:sigma-70 family RNA polymerase sigma factor [Actinokineospora enzanensis]|uniref:sigma-70 family RNA polymerase sigma factor n=1 Tax=Actinokineospora enzanensis TaxID=155975 RepID=UPI00037B20F1|nr:sigma-70 family RNA polymerase sigma factor [Actinokineospora enzanensis]
MDALADRFEAQRGRLRGVAYRMLGSLAEAEDAVQETWLRLSRVDSHGIDDLAAWLRTVVSRICLDMLRTRAARREEPDLPEVIDSRGGPAEEAELAESVGRALLVVLDALGPAERVAFVLHDLFGVPFDRIGPVLDRTPVAAKKLASRARQRVRGVSAGSAPAHGAFEEPGVSGEPAANRHVVEAFLAAARGGDVDALLAVLAPDVVRRLVGPGGVVSEVRGAGAVTREIVAFAQRADVVLLDGGVGGVVAPFGRLTAVLRVSVVRGRVAEYEVITDPVRAHACVITLPDWLRPMVAPAPMWSQPSGLSRKS